MWPIRNSTDSTFKLSASESFSFFFFFFSPFPLGTSLPEQKTHASETLMQWDANIGLHHMILGVVLRKLVFLEVVRQQKSTLGLTPENWPYSSDACSRPQFHTLIQGQPERPAWLKRALQTLTSEACLAAAYVTNVTWGGAPPRQTGSHTSSSQMCSALYLTLIEQLLRGQISLVQNRKRRRERRWGTFLGHLRGGWLGIISRSHAQLWKRWIPPASRPSPDPAAGYSAFPGVQSQVSSEIRLL